MSPVMTVNSVVREEKKKGVAMADVTVTDTWLQIQTGKMIHRLIPVTDEIIRCITSKKEIQQDAPSLIIEKKEYPKVNFTVEETEKDVFLKTEKVWARVELKQGSITWMHPDGRIWLREKAAT